MTSTQVGPDNTLVVGGGVEAGQGLAEVPGEEVMKRRGGGAEGVAHNNIVTLKIEHPVV